MSESVARLPYEHTLAEINTATESLRMIESLPNGSPRALDGPTVIGVLTVRSNLAIASALLAVADTLRSSRAEPAGETL